MRYVLIFLKDYLIKGSLRPDSTKGPTVSRPTIQVIKDEKEDEDGVGDMGYVRAYDEKGREGVVGRPLHNDPS